MIKEKNIIKKLNIEVDTYSMSDAFYFKDNLTTYLQDEIYPIINDILQKLQAEIGNNILRFDTIPLKVDISSIDSINDIKHLINNKLTNILISNKLQESNLKKVTLNKTDSTLDAVMFYLKNGYYPWWFSSEKSSPSKAIKNSINNPLFVSKITAILANDNVQKRLIFQLEDDILFRLFFASKMSKKTLQIPTNYTRIIKPIRFEFWKLLFDDISQQNSHTFIQKIEALVIRLHKESKIGSKTNQLKKGSKTNQLKIGSKTVQLKALDEKLVPLINLCNSIGLKPIVLETQKDNIISLQLAKNKSQQQAIKHNQQIVKALPNDEFILAQASETVITVHPKSIESEQISDSNDYEFIVKNAGLALLHPFLKQFFRNLGFLSPENKILETYHSEALGVLHYLANKQENPEEHELICEKFLCDIPFKQAISPIKRLSKKQKTACADLLDSVLSHWTALKTKNIDVLRNEFLAREGKITMHTEKEKLFIQRKTIDIMLDKLPWSLSFMKFPWKKNMVILEW